MEKDTCDEQFQLKVACFNGHIAAVLYMLRNYKNIDIFLPDEVEHLSPFMRATLNGNADLLAVLLLYQLKRLLNIPYVSSIELPFIRPYIETASVLVPVNDRDEDNRSPIYHVIYNDKLPAVAVLVFFNPSIVFDVDGLGTSALSLCQKLDRPAIARYLRHPCSVSLTATAKYSLAYCSYSAVLAPQDLSVLHNPEPSPAFGCCTKVLPVRTSATHPSLKSQVVSLIPGFMFASSIISMLIAALITTLMLMSFSEMQDALTRSTAAVVSAAAMVSAVVLDTDAPLQDHTSARILSFLFIVAGVSQFTVWWLMYSLFLSDPGYLRTAGSAAGDRHTAGSAAGDRHTAGAAGDRHTAGSAAGDRHTAGSAAGDRHMGRWTAILRRFHSRHSNSPELIPEPSSPICCDSEPETGGQSGGEAQLSPRTYTPRACDFLAALQTISCQRLSGAVTCSEVCCLLCHIPRPLRSGHSTFAGGCVAVYDHFCGFVWADIGRDNYGQFIALLACQGLLALPTFIVLGCCYLFSLSTSLPDLASSAGYVPAPDGGRGTDGVPLALQMIATGGVPAPLAQQWILRSTEIMFLAVFLLWSFSVLLTVLLLLLFHVYLMSRGLTSREFINMSRPDDSSGSRFSYLRGPQSSFCRASVLETVLERLLPVTSEPVTDKQAADVMMKDTAARATVRHRLSLRSVISCTQLSLKTGFNRLKVSLGGHKTSEDMI